MSSGRNWIFKVRTGYSSVVLPTGTFNAGDVVTLTDDQVATLTTTQAASLRTISQPKALVGVAAALVSSSATKYVQKVAAPTGVAATDTAAIQAAHDALTSAGGSLILQPGTYDISSGLTFSKQVKVIGAGAGNQTSACTKLVYTAATGDAITVSAHGCTFEDLAVVNTSGTTPTAGTGVRFSAGIRTRMTRVTVAAFYNCVRFDDGCYQKITDCDFVDSVNYCLYMSNPNSTDMGDQIVQGCQLGGYALSRVPLAAVYWESGGGLKLVGNKINCSSTYIAGSHNSIGTGVLMKVADGVSTSVVVINGNSIEGWDTAGIDIKQSGASNTGTLGKIVITGNEIAGNSGTATAIHPAVASSFREVVVSGNSMGNCATGLLLGNLTACVVGPNTYKSVTTAVSIPASSPVTDLNIDFSRQVVSGDSIVLYTDGGYTAGSTGPLAQGRYVVEREVGSVSSNSVYTVMYRVSVPTFSAGVIRVHFSGNLNGIGAYVYDGSWTFTRAGSGNAAITAIGTAATAGGTVDVQVDVASVAGEMQVGIKRNTTNGTSINGRCVVQVDGNISGLKKGA